MTARYTLASLPPHVVEKLRPADRKALKIRTREESQAALDVKAEKELQAQVEQWLHHRGYLRLTAANAERQATDLVTIRHRGWFGHWVNNKRNPITPDVCVFDLQGRCLMLELKAPGKPKWQPGQREMVHAGFWKLAQSFAEVERLVLTWESAASPSPPIVEV